jgi:hypothetical protein
MALNLEYRAKGGRAWRSSTNESKAFHIRKRDASIERIIEAFWPQAEYPITEREHHSLFRAGYRTYKSTASTPRIDEIKAAPTAGSGCARFSPGPLTR